MGTGRLEARVPVEGAYSLGIWDMQGKRKDWIKNPKAGLHYFTTAAYPSGIYMIEAKTSKATLSGVMVQS